MLNEDLYRAIRSSLGECQILRENESAEYKRVRSPIAKPGTKDTVQLSYSGEEYRCNCPFCGDTKGHLYINYLYGTDESEDLSFPHLAYCHHGCLDSFQNRIALRNVLFGLGRVRCFKLRRDPVFVLKPVVNKQLLPLDNVVPIESLPEDHPAIEYLIKERGYSLELLQKLKVGYCTQSDKWPAVTARIAIPIYFRGVFAGWQARCVGDPNGAPKYYTQPGLKKSAILYNYDLAVNGSYVVITEGVTDVWRVGSAAVCGFGKHLSRVQQDLLCKSGKPLVVLLDTDAEADARKLCETLSNKSAKVHFAQVPSPYTDPGETPTEILNHVIQEALNGKGS